MFYHLNVFDIPVVIDKCCCGGIGDDDDDDGSRGSFSLTFSSCFFYYNFMVFHSLLLKSNTSEKGMNPAILPEVICK